MSGTAAHPPGPDDIPDDAELWRRIPPRHYPQGDGRTWPSSAAFEDPPNGTWMSVLLHQNAVTTIFSSQTTQTSGLSP